MGKTTKVEIDFVAVKDGKSITLSLIHIFLNLLPDIEKEEFQHYGLEGFFHEKIVQIFKEKNIDPRCLEFKIIDTMSIEKAQVCHGGVSLKEVDENLQLKMCIRDSI